MNFYSGWWKLKYWRLMDALEVFSMAGALAEGHTDPEDYLLAARNTRNRIVSLIENDIEKQRFKGKIEWEEATLETIASFPVDENGNPVPPVDYYATTVTKEDFVSWALDKKITVPEEFVTFIEGPGKEMSELPQDQIGLSETHTPKKEPALRPSQRAKERCQAIAEMLWDEDPSIKIKDMVKRKEVLKYGQAGNYQPKAIYSWVTEVAPKNRRKEDLGSDL